MHWRSRGFKGFEFDVDLEKIRSWASVVNTRALLCRWTHRVFVSNSKVIAVRLFYSRWRAGEGVVGKVCVCVSKWEWGFSCKVRSFVRNVPIHFRTCSLLICFPQHLLFSMHRSGWGFAALIQNTFLSLFFLTSSPFKILHDCACFAFVALREGPQKYVVFLFVFVPRLPTSSVVFFSSAGGGSTWVALSH